MRLGGGPYCLPCDASRLETEFPRWLDKVASHRQGGVILVIDSIDRLEVSVLSLIRSILRFCNYSFQIIN